MLCIHLSLRFFVWIVLELIVSWSMLSFHMQMLTALRVHSNSALVVWSSSSFRFEGDSGPVVVAQSISKSCDLTLYTCLLTEPQPFSQSDLSSFYGSRTGTTTKMKKLAFTSPKLPIVPDFPYVMGVTATVVPYREAILTELADTSQVRARPVRTPPEITKSIANFAFTMSRRPFEAPTKVRFATYCLLVRLLSP